MNPPEPKFVKFVAEFSDLGRVSGVGVSFMDAANGNLVLRQAVPVKVGAPPEDVAAQLEVLAAWVRTRVRSRYK